jgi:uncharacterized protein YecT (DUF1311 family)
MWRFILGLVLFASGLASPVVAQPSFDCKGHLSPAETKICSSDELSQLDRALSEKFAELAKRLTGDEKRRLIARQQRWVPQRDVDCGLGFRRTDAVPLDTDLDSIPCLKDEYDNRIAIIDGYDGERLPSPSERRPIPPSSSRLTSTARAPNPFWCIGRRASRTAPASISSSFF